MIISGKSLRLSLAGIAVALPLLGQTATDANGGQMKIEDYLGRPQKEVQQLMTDNQTKGEELYKVGEYKESLPWLDRGLFFSQVLIKQAELRKRAIDLLNEAKKEVDEAKKRLGPQSGT